MEVEIPKEYEDMIKKSSEKYNIPVNIIHGIIKQESKYNKYAFRYEKGWSNKWLVSPASFGSHMDTEINAQKTSWGLMQIMGAVAREHGFDNKYLSELLDPRINLTYGCKHLKKFYDKYENWDDAISAYNQGSNNKDSNGDYENQHYVDMVKIYAGLKSEGL